MQLRLTTSASLVLAACAMALAAPASAQPGPAYPPPPPPPYGSYAGGWQGNWVGPQGQVYQSDPARGPDTAPYPIDPSATRESWLAGCRNRLDMANHGRDAPVSYEGACQGWLSYYEQSGYANNGYGFSYAIPVSVTTIPGHCEPCPAPPRRHWARPVMHDKRIPLSGKRVRVYQ